jgi:tagatose 6-phosphate kinase
MMELSERGAQWVVVTRGRQETLITDGQRFWTASTPAVKVVSAIGSGDAFAAGVASALQSGEPMPQACVLGVACAAANAMTPFSGHVRLEDVQRLRAQVSLT